ncbi:hypothetical protein [Streptomyces olivochromogenes]|uniref:Uncharacterized protein n=1 Tax=Streptomyces olivochromogenes TaxID=1963 RepID=A0A250VKK9_STROL|nr:hypothetical protein [Streptomyces olivochromogenes]GAX54753.1 hypothetical protein SO3561_06306 [Streptomyces olivochromogenes]
MSAVTIHGTLLGSLGLRDRIITATLVDLDGTPQIGFVESAEGELVSEIGASAGTDGSWSMSLYGNDDVTSDYGDTLYRITEGPGFNRYGSNTYFIGVPTTGGPYWVVDLKVTPPGGAAPQSFAVVSVDGLTGVVDLSGRYLGLGGGTLTGALTLNADPASALQAATKQYVDNHSGSATGAYVPLSGGTMSGALVLPGNPSTALQAAPKQYVDNAVAAVSGTYVDTAGDTMTGALTLSGAPSSGLHAATKTYVDNETTRATGAEALLAPKASPTFTGTVSGITKSMVGLGNVDNTADTGKPVSTAQQTALNLKADLASPTFTGTVSGISKSMVGLGNVDNTADTGKPVSTAQQTALNLKADLASPTFTGTVNAAAVTTSGTVTVGGNLSVTGIGSVGYVRSTSNQSISVTGQTASTALVLPVAANAEYWVEAQLIVQNTTGTWTPSWTGPSGATMKWNDTTTSTDYSSTIGATNNAYAASASVRLAFLKGVLKTSSTAGNLTFTTNASTGTTTIQSDSALMIRRVA